jgi:ketosteroid isomerase-like protein
MDYLTYFREVYDAFNRRDTGRVFATLAEDVSWPNAWKGGRLVGREAVRAYWAEQWNEINPEVTPLSVSERSDGSVAVKVRQVVRSPADEILSDVGGRACTRCAMGGLRGWT